MVYQLGQEVNVEKWIEYKAWIVREIYPAELERGGKEVEYSTSFSFPLIDSSIDQPRKRGKENSLFVLLSTTIDSDKERLGVVTPINSYFIVGKLWEKRFLF